MKNKIVCLSTTNFHPLPTRKQNVMTRLRNAEILYFDPPVSYIAPFKDKRCFPRLFARWEKADKPQGNVTVYQLPRCCRFLTSTAG